MMDESKPGSIDAGRRRLLQKTLVGAGVAWTVPVVASWREPVAAAVGSATCPYTWCFDSGTTEGWTINNNAGAGNGLWQVNNGRSVSPSYSLHYGTGVGGNYNTGGRNAGTVTSPSVTLPSSGTLNLEFDVWRQVETFGSGNWDAFSVTVQPAGTVIYNVARDGGTGGVFQHITLSLAAWAGQTIQIVFAFDTGDAAFNNFEGIWVDDVIIPCTTPPPGSLQSLSFDRAARSPDDFFPDAPEPSARDLRRRQRAINGLYTGTVSGD